MKILLVEDDGGAAEILKEALTAQQYLVEIAADGQAGWDLIEAFEYDLILLDWMLPKLDGLSFCTKMRKQGLCTPILLLTANDSSTNKVIGLDAGADDYVVKPYNLDELLARIRALLRRGESTLSPMLEWGALRLDPSSCEITYNEQLLSLTAKEYSLLELFLRNTHRIFSQSALLDHLWSFDEPPLENTVRAHIKSLRRKLKQAGAEDPIETVYGLGYRLRSLHPSPAESIPEQEKTAKSKARIGIQTVVENDAAEKTESQSTTATQTRSVPETVLPELLPIWQRQQHQYCDRVTLLEQVAQGLMQGDKLSKTLKQQAIREAHTLVGSLGSFGLSNASQLASDIETILCVDKPLPLTQVTILGEKLVALQQVLAQAIRYTPSQFPATVSQQTHSSILLVSHDVDLTVALTTVGTTVGIQIEVETSFAQAKVAIAHHQPSVVLLDLDFADAPEAGFQLLEEISNRWPRMTVLVFTERESFADRVRVARLGGQRLFPKPILPMQVMEAIAQVLKKSIQSAAKLLIVDDDPSILQLLQTVLTPWGLQLTLLQNPQRFWDMLEQTVPDLLILDIEMPDLNGIELCQVVRNDPRWIDLPILFLSAHRETETIQKLFAAGADDYVSKPIVGPELVARILSRLERAQLFRQLAQTDSLTGLTNRRQATLDINRLLQLAKRQNQRFCLIFVDLDHFKEINAQYGHDVGDKVLSRFGELLKRNFRNEDVVARWGGEEFMLGLYGIAREEGVKRIQKVLESLRKEQFKDVYGTSFGVTFSAGVVQYPQDGLDLQSLYRVADLALTQAKGRGRSRCVVGENLESK